MLKTDKSTVINSTVIKLCCSKVKTPPNNIMLFKSHKLNIHNHVFEIKISEFQIQNH